jgi:hypothetical protein
MSPDYGTADRLSDHLDAVVSGEATRWHDLDPSMGATVERFFAADDAPGPPPGLADHLWQELMDHTASVELVPHIPALQPDRNGRAPLRLQHVAPPNHRPSALAYLATAALLLLTLAVGFAAIWPGLQMREGDPVHRPALVRALDAVPGDVGEELLVQTSFSVEELPAGEVETIFYRVTLPPGASLTSLMGPLCVQRPELFTSGVGVEVVQSGAYTLRLDAPIRIRRDGSPRPVEAIPAGVEVTLGPGDTAIYPDYSTLGTIRNVGTEPMVVVGVAIVDAEGSGLPTPPLPAGARTEYLAGANPSDWGALPAGPVTVSLWRLTLPEGASVGPYEGVGLEAWRVESGAIARRFIRPGETAHRGRPLFHPAGTTTSLGAVAPGVQRTFTSTGDEPAALLALSIEPASIWSGTLAP